MNRDIRHLVDEQVRKWHKLRETHLRTNAPAPPRRPVVTISREVASLGTEIGARVAEKLELELYDAEIVEQIAENAQVRAALVESVDDRIQDGIENWVGEQLRKTYLAQSEYLLHLSKVLLTIGRHGKAVVIGRGAQFILDPEWTVRVRVVAPMELRIERLATRDGIDAQQARAKVLSVDADRRAFARRHFNRDLDVPTDFDLVINTGTLPVELAADLVARALVGRFG